LITARLKVLSNLKLDEKRLPQGGRFKIELDGERVAFRVSMMPIYTARTVMRLLRENAGGFSLEGLGFHGEALEQIYAATKLANGMILTTGPTGSGKTTTLYTVLEILNTPDVNISTIEDPVEYQMKRINQTQVKPEIGFTFSSGLRALVRQDPDIIMVGEIRDNETASLAINAALTGHLVLSTLHTNSAAGAIPRLIDTEAEPFLLVSTLNVIIGQRLIPSASGHRRGRSFGPWRLTSPPPVAELGAVLVGYAHLVIQTENISLKTCLRFYASAAFASSFTWRTDSSHRTFTSNATTVPRSSGSIPSNSPSSRGSTATSPTTSFTSQNSTATSSFGRGIKLSDT
jgi:hypothetical protein